MNKQLPAWKLIERSLLQNIPVMLLYVLESKGSSPGRQGFLMAVNFKGEMEGSIGGGIMEHKFVELAKQQLGEPGLFQMIRQQFHDKVAAQNQSGMICSGEQTNLLYKISSLDEPHIAALIKCLEENKQGMLTLSRGGMQFSQRKPHNDFFFAYNNDWDWRYEEKIGFKNHLFIIGGGHCALALSKLMSQMDFYIHLFEDRSNLPTYNENIFAQERTVLDDYQQLKNILTGGSHHYVVIMTHGYRTDDIVIRALWDKDFAYWGVLGSRKKIEKMFTQYDAEGKRSPQLDRLYAPIGVPIHSQTPEEIAVSIAAEIIQVKNL